MTETRLAELAPELDAIRHSMAPVYRRLMVAISTGDPQTERAALYQELGGLRTCEQAFRDLVDQMARACFPLALTNNLRVVLARVIERDPADDDPVMASEIQQLLDAGYIRRPAGSRHSLVPTETGKAAHAGISWAKP